MDASTPRVVSSVDTWWIRRLHTWKACAGVHFGRFCGLDWWTRVSLVSNFECTACRRKPQGETRESKAAADAQASSSLISTLNRVDLCGQHHHIAVTQARSPAALDAVRTRYTRFLPSGHHRFSRAMCTICTHLPRPRQTPPNDVSFASSTGNDAARLKMVASFTPSSNALCHRAEEGLLNCAVANRLPP